MSKDPRVAAPVRALAKPPAPKAPAASQINQHAPADAQKSSPSPHDEQPAPAGGKRERKPIEDMVSVTVHTPFRLTSDDGKQHQYHPGVQDVPKSHAEHWFAKHHLDANE